MFFKGEGEPIDCLKGEGEFIYSPKGEGNSIHSFSYSKRERWSIHFLKGGKGIHACVYREEGNPLIV